jgi:hypothetical protein
MQAGPATPPIILTGRCVLACACVRCQIARNPCIHAGFESNLPLGKLAPAVGLGGTICLFSRGLYSLPARETIRIRGYSSYYSNLLFHYHLLAILLAERRVWISFIGRPSCRVSGQGFFPQLSHFVPASSNRETAAVSICLGSSSHSSGGRCLGAPAGGDAELRLRRLAAEREAADVGVRRGRRPVAKKGAVQRDRPTLLRICVGDGVGTGFSAKPRPGRRCGNVGLCRFLGYCRVLVSLRKEALIRAGAERTDYLPRQPRTNGQPSKRLVLVYIRAGTFSIFRRRGAT